MRRGAEENGMRENPYAPPQRVEEDAREMTPEQRFAAARGLGWMWWKTLWWVVVEVTVVAWLTWPYPLTEWCMWVLWIPLAVTSVAGTWAVWRCLDGVHVRGQWFVWTSWAFWFGALWFLMAWNPYAGQFMAVMAVTCMAVSVVKWLEFMALLAKEMKSRRHVWTAYGLMALTAVCLTLTCMLGEFGGWLLAAMTVVCWSAYLTLNLWLLGGLRRVLLENVEMEIQEKVWWKIRMRRRKG